MAKYQKSKVIVMTLTEKYFELLGKANELNIGQFIFEHENKFYLCVFEKFKWSDPMKITKL